MREGPLKFLVLTFNLALCVLSFRLTSYAKEIAIIYTGSTHAMLYPCSCPKNPEGGIARRATLIKQLREENPNLLLLDSGGFFAGGASDEYAQDAQLDMQRSRINLKAMQLMRYDALAIGGDEFNFGREFLDENISESNLAFLSSNITSDRLLRYILKEIDGIKIGVIGITFSSLITQAGGLELVDPVIALKEAIAELKKKGASLIVLLGHVADEQESRLVNGVSGIDVFIAAGGINKRKPSVKIGSTLVLRPSWQGRGLDKLLLKVVNNKITSYKVENIRLSDEIRDDPDMLSILPRCFSDANCKKEGLAGTCQEAGTLKSQCLFKEASKVSLLIVTSNLCKVCNTDKIVQYLKSQFPGLMISYLYYPVNAKSGELIRDLGIRGLPVYLFGKEIEKEIGFATLKPDLDLKGDFYMLNPRLSGLSYLIDREKLKGKLDLFISLYDKEAPELLGVVEEFNPRVHFLTVQQQDGFQGRYGNLEVEEYLRSVCVQKYCPQKFWDYISCRAKNINSSWWDNCLINLDTDKIKACAKGGEGSTLLKENISLNKELGIMFGPTYLFENNQIFGTQGVPIKEELRKIIKG